MAPTSRRRRRRVSTFVLLLLCTTAAGAAGIVVAANRTVDKVGRVPDVAAVLAPASPTVENFLLVGSDSRANSDPNSPDFGGIGSAADVTGSRSDTIMVLRVDKRNDSAALLSLPRDLWVHLPGETKKFSKINAAFGDGPATLVQTVRDSLGIPVHHYVEIDFSGFKALVDSIGGVKVCFELPTRDTNTGLDVAEPGCPVLDGVEALAYARSRHFEQFTDGQWHEDGTADLGRTTRQRDFVNRAIQGALDTLKADPFATGRLATSIGKALRIDARLDPIDAATTLRTAMGAGMTTFALPVVGKRIGGSDGLNLAGGAPPVLDFFRGVTGVAPPVP